WWPPGELVTGPAAAQQRGQLTDMRFLDPASAVGAAAVGAGVTGAALADLAAVINRDLPGLPGNPGDGGLLPLAQLPADGVDKLVAGPRCQRIQVGDEIVAGPGTIAGDHQPPPVLRRQRGDRLTQDRDVIGGSIRPGRPGTQQPGQRLTGVIAPAAQR